MGQWSSNLTRPHRVVVDPRVDGVGLGFVHLGGIPRALPREVFGKLEKLLSGAESGFSADAVPGAAARRGGTSAAGPIVLLDDVRDALLRRRVDG